MKHPRNVPAQSLALPQFRARRIPNKRKASVDDPRYGLLKPKNVSDAEWQSAVADAIRLGFGLDEDGGG